MKIICYDLGSLNTENLEFKECPSCHAELETREVEHSEASIEFHRTASIPAISTFLGQCPICNWWAIREQRQDCELFHPPCEEFIVMDAANISSATPEARGTLAQDDPAPWEQVLGDKACWENPVPMPFEEVVQLFGPAPVIHSKLNTFSQTTSEGAIFLYVLLFCALLAFVVFSVAS